MKRTEVTADLIRAQATLLGLRLTAARAAELAVEVDKLSGAVGGATGQLDFNDEPARFTAILAELKAPAR